jgi:hypothetical protein
LKEKSWGMDEECQETFDKIKQYLQCPSLLVPFISNRPSIIFMTTTKKAMECVLGQHNESGRKERAIII